MSGVFVDVSNLPPGGLRAVKVGALDLVLCQADGAWYALENRCPHAFAPLDAGRLQGCVLECPLHGGRLDVRDGSPLALPIRKPATTFAVRPVPGGIEIDVAPRSAGAGRDSCTI